jgi:hypothetical protein
MRVIDSNVTGWILLAVVGYMAWRAATREPETR